MAHSLNDLQREIMRRRDEIKALEGAYETIRSILGDGENSSPKSELSQISVVSESKAEPVAGDLAGSTIRIAALKILSERADPLHPRDVARIACDRGYRGMKSGLSDAAIAKNFADVMRTSDDFAKDDQGRYRLASVNNQASQRPEKQSVTHQHVGSSWPTTIRVANRADAIEAVLRDKGRPLTVNEILVGLAESGQSIPSERRSAFNSVYGSLKHAEDRFEKVDRGLWWLRSTEEQ